MDKRRLMLRDRIIGVLLRDARRQNGRTKAECADALGIASSTLDAYEEGRLSISLPELEVLGYLLGVPIAHFLEPEPELMSKAHHPDFGAVIDLRRRMVGAMLRQARLDAGMKRQDLADWLDCSTNRIANYEHGEQTVPIAELELLARKLDVPLEHFLEGHGGVIGRWHRQEEMDRRFRDLPPAVQAFVTGSTNLHYVEVAMKLSHLPASGLRSITEGLLEIAA